MPIYHVGIDYESRKRQGGHGDVLIDLFVYSTRKLTRREISDAVRDGVRSGGEELPAGVTITGVSWRNPERRVSEWRGDGNLDKQVPGREPSDYVADLPKFDNVVRSVERFTIAELDTDDDVESDE